MYVQLIDSPWIILLFPIFIVFTMKLHKSPEFGIYFTALLLPFEDLTTLFVDFTLIKLVLIMTLLVWLIQLSLDNKKAPSVYELRFLFFVFLLSILSLLWAYNLESSIKSLITFMQLIILLILMIGVLDNEEKILLSIKIFLFSSIIATVVALFMIQTADLQFNRAVLLQGQNPNGFSRCIGISLIILIYALNSGNIIKSNFIKIGGILITGLIVILAQSRGTYAALLIGFIPLFINSSFKSKFKNMIIFSLVAIILVNYFSDILEGNIFYRLEHFGNLGGRLVIWQVGIEMIKDNLLFGVGFGNFSDIFEIYSYQHRGWFSNSGAHNVYVALLSEIGIIGFSLFCLFLGTIIKNILKLSREFIETRNFLLALIFYLIIGGLTNSIHLSKYYWFTFGLIITITKISYSKMNTLSKCI